MLPGAAWTNKVIATPMRIKTYLIIATATLLAILSVAHQVLAGESTGTMVTGVETGPSGVVVSTPTPSPVAGSYTSTQSVTLSAVGAPYACYTVDGSDPACNWNSLSCSVGSIYSSAISVASTQTVKALSCYQGSVSSSVMSAAYTISSGSSSGGGGGGGGGGDLTAPTNIAVSIAGRPQSTENKRVNLVLAADGASYMMISNAESFISNSGWLDFAATYPWDLTSGAGTKWIYAKFKDASGNISSVASTSVILKDATPATTTATSTEIEVLGEKITDERTVQLNKIISEAELIDKGDISLLLTTYNLKRDTSKELSAQNNYYKKLFADFPGLTAKNVYSIINFIAYGTETTFHLGAGERAGVLNSYRSAFGKLPRTVAEWQDVLKIANGRWPKERSAVAEKAAQDEFVKVYKRKANMSNPNDNAAVTIIAYGLRSSKRNMESERNGIKIFRAIFRHNPVLAREWDIVRAISYSGAVR